MFPTPEKLAEIAASPGGKLAEVSFAQILRALAENRLSCVLEIRRRRLIKRIAVESGVPVACESNLVHERFGPFLVSIGRLSEQDFTTSFSESITKDVPLGEILVEKGLITLEQLYRLLQQCLAKQLLDGFTWTDGDFSLLHDEMQVHAPLKVRVHQLIVTGVTRFAPQELVDSAVMTLIGQRLALHPSPVVAAEELRLDKCSRGLVALLQESPLSMSALVEGVGLEMEEVSRSIYALGTLGLLVDAESAAKLEDQVPGRTTQPIPVVRELPDGGVTSEDVMRLFLSYRRLDAFELLGLDPSATEAQIDAAFFVFSRRFSPLRFADGALESVQEQGQELFLSGARAYAVLCDKEQRESLIYRRERREKEAGKEERVGPSRIHTDLLDPEAQYRKGLKLLEKGDHQRALQYLEFATDCDPQNGLYRAQLAHCRYCIDPSSAQSVLKHLVETHRVDPGCGLAYLYAGEIAGDLEMFDHAETLLREAGKLLAPDRRPIEKLKELSAKMGKKPGRKSR